MWFTKLEKKPEDLCQRLYQTSPFVRANQGNNSTRYEYIWIFQVMRYEVWKNNVATRAIIPAALEPVVEFCACPITFVTKVHSSKLVPSMKIFRRGNLGIVVARMITRITFQPCNPTLSSFCTTQSVKTIAFRVLTKYKLIREFPDHCEKNARNTVMKLRRLTPDGWKNRSIREL